MMRRLGRTQWFDDRSREHPAVTRPIRPVTWPTAGGSIDQLQTNWCTGVSMRHTLNTRPVRRCLERPGGLDSARAIYAAATEVDEWSEWTFPPDDMGSSVLAACKVTRASGMISSYSWCFGLDHVLGALAAGPVILGTDWHAGMNYPDAAGRVQVTGEVEGGHAYAAVGVDPRTRTVECLNSWGPRWGRRGRFWIGWDDLDTLLHNHGEAAQVHR